MVRAAPHAEPAVMPAPTIAVVVRTPITSGAPSTAIGQKFQVRVVVIGIVPFIFIIGVRDDAEHRGA
jgi:hypothetical protein